MNKQNEPVSSGALHVPSGTGKHVWFSGDVYTVMLTAADSGGALGAIYASVPPGGGPPDHFHAEHDEFFYILDGQLQFTEGERCFTAASGDFVMIRQGTLHHFHNAGTYPVGMLFFYTPGGPEGLFVEGGDEPVPGQQVQPWGPERIDARMLQLLQRYDNQLPPPSTE